MLTTIGLIIAVLVSLIFYAYKWSNGNKAYWKDKKVSSIDGKVPSQWERMSFKQTFHEMELKIYNVMKSEHLHYGGSVQFRKPELVITDLDDIKSVMIKDFDAWVNRRTLDMQKSDPLFNQMLTQSKDQHWKNLRSTLSPTFTTGKIRKMYEIFDESSEKLAKFLLQKSKTEPEIEFRDAFTRFTMDVISSTAFGLDSKSFEDPETDSTFCKMAKRFQSFASPLTMLKFIVFFMFPKFYQELRIPIADSKSTEFFSNVTRTTIRHREETGERRNDFLQLLIDAKNNANSFDDEEGELEKPATQNAQKIQLTEELILSQSLLFFLAGFDTVETFLLFATYELAVNPEVQEKLYEEISLAAKKNDGKLNYDIIMKCEYLDKVVSETLRRYPPGIRTERVSVKEYKFPDLDLVLEKGTVLVIPIYGIHHDPDYFPDPFKFDPERFSSENKASRHPCSYMPFGMGPRNCIANRFALAEGKAAIAHLIWKFKLEPGSKTNIPMKFSTKLVFKPEGGLWLQVKPRK